MKKLGIIAYASQTGLGYQTKAIYDNLKPEKTLLVDLSKLNGMPIDKSWYPDARLIQGIPNREACEWLVDGIDTLLVCETPLNYYLFEYAKRKGVKIIHQFNPEFLDYFKKDLVKPDISANPTTWMWDEIETLGLNQMILPVPIELKEKRNIKNQAVIGHIVGRPTYQDRNGTLEFLEVVQLLEGLFEFKIFYQEPKDRRAIEYFEPIRRKLEEVKNIQVLKDVEDKEELFEIDALVLPRKYGGLCLPRNEALARGIPVFMPNIPPNGFVRGWSYEADYEGSFDFHTKVNVYKSRIEKIIDVLIGNQFFGEENSEIAYKIAQDQSWEKLKKLYTDLI